MEPMNIRVDKIKMTFYLQSNQIWDASNKILHLGFIFILHLNSHALKLLTAYYHARGWSLHHSPRPSSAQPPT